MKRRTTPVLVGAFVFTALLIGIFILIFFGRGGFWSERATFVLYFKNSVSGLSEGAPVQFRGVRIGQVSDIHLMANPETMTVKIPVFIEIQAQQVKWKGVQYPPKKLFTTMVDKGLRAQLKLQSFITGQSMIELDIIPNTPKVLVSQDNKYPEIPTIPSRLQQLSQTVEKLPVEDLFNKLISAVEGIEQTINSPKITNTMENLSSTVQDLNSLILQLEDKLPSMIAQMDSTMVEIQDLVSNANKQMSSLSYQTNATLNQSRNMLVRTDGRLEKLSHSLDQAIKSARSSFKQLEQTVSLKTGPSGKLISNLTATLEQTRQALSILGQMTNENSEFRYQLSTAIKEISSAARSVKSLSSFLERNPEALLRGKNR